ncbi:glutamate dehydrogenase [uncultured Flavobacterium sp.]|uniref:THC0290_0291 family protein n=1 Tax=uncultured Flavobacterium sp. TaxID=165435 RepID=UPI0030C8B0F7
MLKKFIIPFFFVLFIGNEMHAQFGRTYQEVGIMAGPVFFKSDYGERGDFENFSKNMGFSAGVFYYFSFIENYRSLRENFKLRLDASYMKTNLEHYGKYVDPAKNSLFAEQLRAMHGSTSTINLGLQMEFYPWKTDDYNRSTDFSPYMSLGGQIGYFTSKVESDLGPIGTSLTTPIKYSSGTRNDSNPVASLTSSIGVRYRLDDYNSLIFDSRLQYYTSDWVDGINPNRNDYPENKTNDYSLTFNFGYVYYFN